jgi:Trk K+ transport system NAD-binding subunit
VGRTIGELDLREEVVIAAIARGKRMISPRGGVRFEAGDHVYVIATDAGEDPVPEVFQAAAPPTASAPQPSRAKSARARSKS